MAFKKLKFSEQDIREIKAYREKLQPKKLDSGELSEIIGGCGALCESTCSYYCRPVCTAACESNCWAYCEDTCNSLQSGPEGCENCAYTIFGPWPI